MTSALREGGGLAKKHMIVLIVCVSGTVIRGVQKSQLLADVICERPLLQMAAHPIVRNPERAGISAAPDE